MEATKAKKRQRKRIKDPSWRPVEGESDDDDDSGDSWNEEVQESVRVDATSTKPKKKNASTAKRRKTAKSEHEATAQLVPLQPQPELQLQSENGQKVTSSAAMIIPSFIFKVLDKLKWLYYDPKETKEEIESNKRLNDKLLWTELVLHEPLSSGTFGDVFRGTWRGKEVAIKVLKSLDNSDFAKEVNILSKLQHPNIVQYIGACKEPYKMIVMEYIKRGSLHAVLHVERLILRDNLPLLCSISIDILQGLHFLHSQQIIHRDIKPGNILIDHNNTTKITDFGISKEISSSTIEAMTGFVGTVAYMAPELMVNGTRQIKYDNSVDLYSFGVVLWEMLSSKVPFTGMTAIAIGLNVTEKKMRPSDFERGITSPNTNREQLSMINEVIKQCWDHNPARRPRLLQLISEFRRVRDTLQ